MTSSTAVVPLACVAAPFAHTTQTYAISVQTACVTTTALTDAEHRNAMKTTTNHSDAHAVGDVDAIVDEAVELVVTVDADAVADVTGSDLTITWASHSHHAEHPYPKWQ